MGYLPKSKAYIYLVCLIIGKAVQGLILGFIRFYQVAVSPLMPAVCRFYPSCSQYFYEAVKTRGVLTGSYLGIRRLLRCHPFHSGGYDPLEQGGKS